MTDFFNVMKTAVEQQFKKMVAMHKDFYVANIENNVIWEEYLESIPAKMNPIYRVRREYDCSGCKHFIRTIGRLIVFDDNYMPISVWDTEKTGVDWIDELFEKLASTVKSKEINGIFLTKFDKYGCDHNFEYVPDGENIKWEHFYAEIPTEYIRRDSVRINEEIANRNDTKKLLYRGITELTTDAIDSVIEISVQGSLYKGDEWIQILKSFKKIQKEYNKLDDAQKEGFLWETSKASPAVCRIKNTSIGTLLEDISAGTELDVAVSKYEKIVAPENYKRPKAIYTKKMIEDAQKTITELGYMDSLKRRFANLDDITVNNIIFSNRDAAQRISGNIFDELKETVAVDPKKFSKNEEIKLDDFIKNVIPNINEMELLLENRFSNNLVSLIAPVIPDSKTMFKWNNNFSWAYSGNMTDSSLKRNVKNAGGNVDGVLRFSIQWNDIEDDFNDLDAHCKEPNDHIYYGTHKKPRFSTNHGQLDIDIIDPRKGVPAVENIYYDSVDKMKEGEYKFFVNCFGNRGGKSGFRAEIEFDGNIYSYEYNNPLKQGENVEVATVTLKNGKFTIKENLKSSASSKKIWGVDTCQFVPVSVAMFSPNYWDEQKGVGNKHFFMMIKGCVNDEEPNAFFNEYLKDEIVSKHKRVFEALGSKAHVEDTEDQLSGVGFSLTKRDKFVVKVKGATERVLTVLV